MAAHADEAYERRLRPVYDALDARSWKARQPGPGAARRARFAAAARRSAAAPHRRPPLRLSCATLQQAVKLADGVLKKAKKDQLARALKAYGLHRCGKAEEALQARQGASASAAAAAAAAGERLSCCWAGGPPALLLLLPLHLHAPLPPPLAAPSRFTLSPTLPPPSTHPNHQLMGELAGEGPESERVAMTMAYTLKAAGRLGDITAAYASLAERQPRDPEALAGLFRAHVR